MKEVITKYDALLLKTLHKIESSHKQLEKETKVFNVAYAQLQNELATFDIDTFNVADARTEEDDD